MPKKQEITNKKEISNDNKEIDTLRKQLNEERYKNTILEDENKELKKKINNLTQDYDNKIKNYIIEIESLNKSIQKFSLENNDLKTKINSQNNINSNDPNEIVRLYKKIEELTEKINRYPFTLEKDEEMLSVIFMSGSQKFTYSMICKNTDTINKLESELYTKFPELSETENYFLCKGTVANKFKKFKELNIKNGDIMIINQRED